MDIQYLIFLQQLRDATAGCLNAFFAFITSIAVDYYMAIPALIIFWAVDKKKGSRILASWGTALLGNAILKSTFTVYRPWIRSSKVKPLPEVMSGATGYSFPSGHSSSSTGFYSGVINVYRKNRALVGFCVMMVLLTMFSRNFVGVHTPQDVVVGALLGVAAAWIASRTFDWIDTHPGKDWVLLLVSALLCCAALCYIRFKSYPMDYVDGVLLVDPKKMTVDGFKDPGRFFGIVLGWYLERRFINFSTDVSIEKKVVRCCFGAFLFVFYWTVIAGPAGKAVGSGFVHFLLQASNMTLFMTVYPLAFMKWESRKN